LMKFGRVSSIRQSEILRQVDLKTIRQSEILWIVLWSLVLVGLEFTFHKMCFY
jgi:hypothetical protein